MQNKHRDREKFELRDSLVLAGLQLPLWNCAMSASLWAELFFTV